MKKTHIIIHHSLTEDNALLFNMGAIRSYHINVNGWRDIGYHFVIDEVLVKPEIIIGRMIDERGAHTKELNFNEVGIGICVVGNFDIEAPPSKKYAALVKLCRSLMATFGIPAENVLGHREAQALGGCPAGEMKTCPGRMFDMDKLRDILKIP